MVPRRPGREDQPSINAKLSHGNEAKLAFHQFPFAIVIFCSGRSEFAIIAVSPAMIGATQKASVLAISAAHAHPSMPAGIEKGPHDPLVVAHQDGWVQAALPADQVSRVWNFTFVAEKEPAAAKDALDLHLIDVGVGEDAPRDQSFLRAPMSSRCSPLDSWVKPFSGAL